MQLCLPDDRGGTETSTVKRLDLERPSLSAVNVYSSHQRCTYTVANIFIPSQTHAQLGYWKDTYNATFSQVVTFFNTLFLQ